MAYAMKHLVSFAEILRKACSFSGVKKAVRVEVELEGGGQGIIESLPVSASVAAEMLHRWSAVGYKVEVFSVTRSYRPVVVARFAGPAPATAFEQRPLPLPATAPLVIVSEGARCRAYEEKLAA